LRPTIDGSSDRLKNTRVVPTLDATMEFGKNLVWCSSFLASWKACPLHELPNVEEICRQLNSAPDPIPDMPGDKFYVAGGWARDGITDEIAREMGRRFPHRPTPEFHGVTSRSLDAYIGYAYLEGRVRFTIPYFEHTEPIVFKDTVGTTTAVHGFGVRKQDKGAYSDLREQVHILFQHSCPGSFEPCHFALDLCRDSQPLQIIVARTETSDTLAHTLAIVERDIRDGRREGALDKLATNDMLAVPDMFWRLVHHFTELEQAAPEGSLFMQEIEFRLDKSGADLVSEGKSIPRCAPADYRFDEPFLIIMKKRGSERPFLVMWVDNAELLQHWEENG
jgi:hypothetical protein